MDIFTKEEFPEFSGQWHMGSIGIENLTFSVIVIKSRLRFGHVDYLVRPLHGTGEQWIEQHRITIEGIY